MASPPELIDFPELGEGETHAPSTDVDVMIHCHATRHDLLFYTLRKGISGIAQDIEIVDETYGFRYLDARDMTSFIDGTETRKLRNVRKSRWWLMATLREAVM